MSATGQSGTGSITYDGTTTSANSLGFVDYGDYYGNGAYNVDMYIVPVTIDWDTGDGDGRYVYLETFHADSVVATGDLDFSSASAPPAGHYSDSSDVSVVVGGNETTDELTGGTISVDVSGGTYTISGTCSTDSGKTVTFSYTGPLTYLE